jgi:hypothetical protein
VELNQSVVLVVFLTMDIQELPVCNFRVEIQEMKAAVAAVVTSAVAAAEITLVVLVDPVTSHY